MNRTRAAREGKKMPQLAGGWIAVGALGRGGNGTVFRAVKDGVDGAFKLLHENSTRTEKRLRRFVREIEAMERCRHLPGILPLLDAVRISEGMPVEHPWLVTAVATPMENALRKDAPLGEIVAAVYAIASALAEMHALGISHRDIKPDNLFFLEDRWCVGDLGLAAHEDQCALTTVGERLGPTFYIATEMLNGDHPADGKKADVFSLSKTMWKLATGQNFPIPGAYARGQAVYSLATYIVTPRAVLLDPLICMATDHDPNKRPTMQEFADGLEQWLKPPAPLQSSGPIPIDVNRYGPRIESMKAEAVARADAAALHESERKSINARWVGPLTALTDKLYASLGGLQFDNVIWNQADVLNCGGSVDAWLDLAPSGARATLRLIYYFDAFQHPRCWLAFTAAIEFHEQPGANNTESLCEKRFDLIEGTAQAHRVIAELNELVDSRLQEWVGALYDRVEAYAEHRAGFL